MSCIQQVGSDCQPVPPADSPLGALVQDRCAAQIIGCWIQRRTKANAAEEQITVALHFRCDEFISHSAKRPAQR